jgi:hypothetical protein
MKFAETTPIHCIIQKNIVCGEDVAAWSSLGSIAKHNITGVSYSHNAASFQSTMSAMDTDELPVVLSSSTTSGLSLSLWVLSGCVRRASDRSFADTPSPS